MRARRVMPTTRLPNFNESPLFLRGEGGRLTPVAPLGEVRLPGHSWIPNVQQLHQPRYGKAMKHIACMFLGA